jgi:hypothetical protein
MTDKEAMKLALDALENIIDAVYVNSDQEAIAVKHANIVITALKERLADPMREVQRLGQEIEQEPMRLQCVTCGTVYADGVPPQVAQPEQEPVAWGVFEGNLHDMFFTQDEAQEMARLKGTHAEVRPLYTTPPQRTEQEPVAAYSDIVSDGGLDPRNKFDAPPQRTEERNFCPTCGKRTKDLTHIHTCTPPQENT